MLSLFFFCFPNYPLLDIVGGRIVGYDGCSTERAVVTICLFLTSTQFICGPASSASIILDSSIYFLYFLSQNLKILLVSSTFSNFCFPFL